MSYGRDRDMCVPADILSRELRVIRGCVESFMRAANEDELLADICKVICTEAGYRMAWAGTRESGEERIVRRVASSGVETGYLTETNVAWVDMETGPVGDSLRDGGVECIQDIARDPAAGAWRESALRRNYHSRLLLPLRGENQFLFGVLGVYSRDTHAFTEDELRLMKELARNAAFGVAVLRTRLRHERLEEQSKSDLQFFASMDRINSAIRRDDNLEQMLGDILEVALADFGCDRAWLTHPADPGAEFLRVTMERTRPEYPGAQGLGVDIPMNDEMRSVIRTVVNSEVPVVFGEQKKAGMGAKSMIATVIHVTGSPPYMFGLHQCSQHRVWSKDEQKLLQSIGRRLSDALTSMQAHHNLQQNEARLRTLVQTIPDLVWVKDPAGVYLACNAGIERLCGALEADIVGKTEYDFFGKDEADNFTFHDRRAMESRKSCTNEEWLTFVDNGYRGLFETIKTPMLDHSGKVIGVVGIARDITERYLAEEQRRITATAFEAQDGIAITGADRVILKINSAFTQMTGYTSEDAVGKTLRELLLKHDEPMRPVGGDGSWQGEVQNRRRSGENFPAWMSVTAVKDDRDEVTHYVVTMTDITARKEAERAIAHLAFYDSLTRLPNRRLLLDRLQQALALSARSLRKGALLFIDLDNFKILNDTIGHDVGDRLLCEVAQRLDGSVRMGDTVARLGGDEFVVLLEDLDSCPQEAAAQAKIVGEKILAELNRPYLIGEHTHHSTPSIGVALFTDTGNSVDELLKHADIAMYQAKSAGRNALRFFDPEMQAALAARATLEAALRQGIQNNQFVLHYQPQVDSVHGIVGAEALLRWDHPDRGTISPAQFVPLAEETGLILPIGQWVLETACAVLRDWAADARTRELFLSINVSARQFRQPDFVDQVRGVLDSSGAPPERLKLELTESLVLDDIERTIQKMHALRQIGVRFSMDDFGTGYSSLSYLTRLPLDQLKIDQSFVRKLPDSATDAAVVQTIITLARSLGLAVIAEGVETEPQRQFLESHGCPAYQGYLCSKPVPLAAYQKLLSGYGQRRRSAEVVHEMSVVEP
jgi:diguanylate cyclase (GGDEF)-like protein/PAS domain S-box-containing protein